jgi:hypothetical protein
MASHLNQLEAAQERRRNLRTAGFLAAVTTLISAMILTSCAEPGGDAALTQNTYVELVDWHIAGLWVINCPVAWLRVANYNPVPVKDITIEYQTYDFEGKPLDRGTYRTSETDDDTVKPGQVRNFIEKYLGLVSLQSDKLSIKLKSVQRGD